MKRLYFALVTLLLAFTIFAPTTWADEPNPSAVNRVLDFSGWSQFIRPITELRRTTTATPPATPTPRYNKVIYPLPADAEVVPVWDTRQTIIFNTYLSMEEVMDFYRMELGPDGATERPLLTVFDAETNSWFSMVFDGWKYSPERSVVVQGVQISPYQYVVTIRLEKV